MSPIGRRSAAAFLRLPALAALLVVFPAAARAQAWLPFRGEGYVSFIVQSLRLSGHFDTDGSRLTGCAPSSAVVTIPEFEYGLTDKLAIDARVAYVASRYTGSDSDPCTANLRQLYEEMRKRQPLAPPLSSLDTGAFYGTVQDLAVGLRYNVLEKGITLTPGVGVTIPTHAYRTVGEAAPGQGRRALHLGVNAARLLDPLLPDAYIQVRYAYSFVEPLYGIALNRSNLELEGGYAITPTLSVRALLHWQQTHGGITYAEAVDRGFGNAGTSEPLLFLDHDRLLKDRYLHFGVGATITLTDKIDLDAAVVTFLAGADSHYGVGVTFDVGWRFFRSRGPSPSIAPR